MRGSRRRQRGRCRTGSLGCAGASPLARLGSAESARAERNEHSEIQISIATRMPYSGELTGSRAHMEPLGQVPSVTKTGFGTGNRSVPFLGMDGTFEAPSALTGTSLVSV